MEAIQLSNSDLVVSRLCFGCWGIVGDFHWGDRDHDQSVAAMHAALDVGVNFFDTAAVYGDGESEKLVGRVLSGRRDQVTIASKVLPDRMKPDEILRCCEESLTRLGTDYIDLYQTHWTSRETPAADSWDAMLKLKQQGKVRHIGVCNAGVSDLGDFSASEPPVADQLPYSLLWRAIEHDILPRCLDNSIGILVYSPLMHGMLADKYKTAADVPDGRARSRHFGSQRPLTRHGEAGCEEGTFSALAAISDVCRRLERTMADVALAWCLQQPGVSCVIAGVSSQEQLAQNVYSVDNPLPDDAVSELNKATSALKQALGPNPDMWEGSEKSRFR